MAKTLTKLQEQIVAKVLTISAVEYVYCRGGEVNSVNNLRDRGLLKGDCWGSVQHRHLTDEIKSVFWAENPVTFRIPNLHGEGWLVFDDRQYIAKVYNDEHAIRMVDALALLRSQDRRAA